MVEAGPLLVGKARVLGQLLRERRQVRGPLGVVAVVQVVLVLKAGRGHLNGDIDCGGGAYSRLRGVAADDGDAGRRRKCQRLLQELMGYTKLILILILSCKALIRLDFHLTLRQGQQWHQPVEQAHHVRHACTGTEKRDAGMQRCAPLTAAFAKPVADAKPLTFEGATCDSAQPTSSIANDSVMINMQIVSKHQSCCRCLFESLTYASRGSKPPCRAFRRQNTTLIRGSPRVWAGP